MYVIYYSRCLTGANLLVSPHPISLMIAAYKNTVVENRDMIKVRNYVFTKRCEMKLTLNKTHEPHLKLLRRFNGT